MAGVIVSYIHPLNDPRVLAALRIDRGASEDQVAAWIAEGFAALEGPVARHGGSFAFGDRPTMTDCCLVPQLYPAERLGVDLAPFPRPTVAARALPPFADAHPDRQPDALQP